MLSFESYFNYTSWPMSETTEIRTGRHCVFLMHAHLVFVTKYRRTVFSADMLNTLQQIFSEVCDSFEAELTEFEGENDHVHLLVHFPPKVALSKLVNSLKGVSSRILRRDYPKECAKYFWKGVLWSPSYFAASCGGAPLDVIKDYIQSQDSPRIHNTRKERLTSPA